jgi:2-hydroxyglutarate dehydrogenase
VVARHDQRPYIEKLHTKSLSLQWPSHSLIMPQTEHVLPTELLSGERAREMEPDLSDEIVAALWCPLTGIVDSHALMESLERDISESEGGELVLATNVVRVDPYQGSTLGVDEGWVVQATDGSNNEGFAILARNLINASGLSSALVLNSILSKDKQIPMYYARGSYASYHGPGVSHVSHLIYPCPETGHNAHAFESLGTHLTLDLQGKIRFGPDIEWMSPPASVGNDESEDDGDFWMHHLIPDVSRLRDMHHAVTTYLPGVQLHGLQPDYVGIRPKLIPRGGGFQDFVLRVDYPCAERNRRSPMVSLLGIESPGLTSSLALAEIVVEDIVARHIWFE